MAGDGPRRRRDGALGVVGAVALGAISATLVGPPALADDPEYPSWADVQRAKTDRSAADAEAGRITGLLGDLQDRADAAGRTAAIAAERFHRAKLAEDERVTLCLLPLADGVTLARRRDTGPAPTGSGAA